MATSISVLSSSSTTSSITLVCSVYTQWGGTVWVQATASGKTGNSSRATMTAGQTRSFTATITGLSSGTRYTVTAQLNSTEMSGIVSTSTEVYTQASPTQVDPWTWTGSNGQATATQTRNAYAILQGTREPNDFSHYVWNDLVDKVSEMRRAKGHSWTTNGGELLSEDACKVYAGDTMSALQYNSIKTNIGSILSTGIPDVSAGDEITGYMIVHLTDVLNQIIAGL